MASLLGQLGTAPPYLSEYTYGNLVVGNVHQWFPRCDAFILESFGDGGVKFDDVKEQKGAVWLSLIVVEPLYNREKIVA